MRAALAIHVLDDVYYPQEALTTRTRTEHTDIHHGHPTPICTHAHLRSRYTAGPVIQGLHLRIEGLGGCVGQRLRHVACPTGTGRHATGRERLSPQHPAHTHKHPHQREGERSTQKKFPKKEGCGVTVAGLSHEATTATSHKVTDASTEGVGLVWPGSG